MKVLYLITGLDTGGAEVVLKDLVSGLDKNRYEVTVVSILPVGEIGREMEENGIKVLSLEAKRKYNPSILIRLIKILKKEKPDILHTHLFHADLLGRVAGKISGAPSVMGTIHNVEIGGRVRELLLRAIKSFSDIDIAVSKMVAENAIKEQVSDKERIKVIYNGINTGRFGGNNETKKKLRAELDFPCDTPVFVSVGRIHRQKGYRYLVESVEEVVREYPGPKFYILGDGEDKERKELEDKIKKLDLGGNIVLAGNVPNVGEYLTAADFYVSSSLWEGFSIALLEAAGSGLVIVATDVGGNAEVIKEGETGFLVEPGNSLKLAEKIKYVLSLTDEKQRKIGRNASLLVREQFSIEKMVEKHERLYRQLVKERV